MRISDWSSYVCASDLPRTMKLVIVESPAKAKTIEKYLGGDYRVLASYGHVRDLPPKDGSVNPDDGFAMEWEAYADKAKQLTAITDDAKKADDMLLATDRREARPIGKEGGRTSRPLLTGVQSCALPISREP